MTAPPRGLPAWIPFLWSRVVFPGTVGVPTPWRWSALGLFLVLPALLLYPTLSFHLLEPDEGRYAQIPREMLLRGDWIVPHLQGQPYLDKPPLFYWLVMLSYSLFGIAEWPARLIPALSVHATIVIVYLIGRRSLGERAAFWAALALCLAPGFMGMGRILLLDGLLTFWITLALLAGFEAIRSGHFRPAWWYLAAVASGLGVLTKGPIPLLLVIPPLVLHRWLTGTAAPIPRRHAFGFLTVVAALNAPWYTAILLRQPVFLRYFFWEHNILRFVQPFDHLQPVWYFVPIVLLGLLPGSLLLGAYLRDLFSADAEHASARTPAAGFVLLAGLWCILFFSLSGSKLPTYVLPAFPPLCLVLGDFVARSRWQAAVSTRVAAGGAAAVLAFAFYYAIPTYAELRSPMGPPEIADRLHQARGEAMYCFPRNVDSVAFYTGRQDLRSCRTKFSQELVEALLQHERAVVLFTHRHSLETFRQVLPPQLRITEAVAVKHHGTGARFLDAIVGDGPWGLCHVAVIERVPAVR